MTDFGMDLLMSGNAYADQVLAPMNTPLEYFGGEELLAEDFRGVRWIYEGISPGV